MKRITTIILAWTLIISSVLSGLITQNSFAAPVTGFKAGHIIDDTIFQNNISMNPRQIQEFLNSKVPVCDTNGTQPSEYGGGTRAQWAASKGYPTTFTCLKDYSENGNSSAQIIYNISQQYSINPQVLIVLLQKEQGLVTDTWPVANQYKTATGYGCPDTAPCDSQYFGLTNQLTWSAKMYHAILTNSPTWYTPYILGNNYVQWNPSSSCGGSTINIENLSTVALYSYTPYQPNQAALNAGYGQGDSCSAYGNRNFYLYFTDWFGTTSGVVPEKNAVWRLYNPFTGGHFLTASALEATQYVTQGWLNDGVAFHTPVSGGTPVYRLYNGRTHFFTDDATVKDKYVQAGWINDGPVFNADTSGSPIWQLWNGSSHFYTADSQELERYLKSGWKDDGVVFYQTTVDTNAVWRLYNPYTGGHLLTASSTELNAYLAVGWHNDGIVFHSDPNGIPVYRLFNGRTHFFTTDTTVRDTYVRAGWINDGEIFKTSSTGSPVYQLWSGISHFYTTDPAEKNVYTSSGWKDDGIVFYTSNLISIHRVYQSSTGAHALVSSASQLWSKLNSGWTDDGVVFSSSTSYGSPVYQLFNSGTSSYFYTTSATDRSTYISAGWRDDGITFYGLPTGIGVHRIYNSNNHTHMITANDQELNAYKSAGWIDDGIVFNVSL